MLTTVTPLYVLKILAFSGPESGSITASTLALPIHRVYEMRGTMFHEIQGTVLCCVGRPASNPPGVCFLLIYSNIVYCCCCLLCSAHKLALHDLGKAIAINPIGADNYYLRGDCHSKLGNYEQVGRYSAAVYTITSVCSVPLHDTYMNMVDTF